jgi:hypothetical protein
MNKKPRHSRKKHTFKISIDDGYCEWTYPLTISESYSIYKIMARISAAFRQKMVEGELRPSKGKH